MTGQTIPTNLVVRMRREGNSTVISVPVSVREALHLVAGDLLLLRVVDDSFVARKVDLAREVAMFDKASGNGGT